MAVFAGIDLKKWRESQNISAADLAERISCDATTIYRYESGKLKPDPDVMYELCDALGDVDIWTIWMRTQYPASYGRVHPDIPRLSFEGKLLSAFAEIEDVMKLQGEAMKDGADGRIDDEKLRFRLWKECNEAIGSLQGLANSLNWKGGASDG